MTQKTVSRQVRWAHAQRAHLLKILGEKCVRCMVTTNLTFDCIKPTGGRHHRLSSVARMTFYNRQFRLGNLQILCHDCNSKKGASPQPPYFASTAIFL